MNDIEKELVNYKYKNNDINQWVAIFKRTKKKRIKNKQFLKILVAAIKERKVIKLSDVVMVDIDIYQELKYYEKLHKELSKDVTTFSQG